MSPNVRESEATGRKRSHDDFTGQSAKAEKPEVGKTIVSGSTQTTIDSMLPAMVGTDNQPSPRTSPGLTEAGSSTPTRKSPSPQTPTKKNTTQISTSLLKTGVTTSSNAQSKSTTNPPTKKKRLTGADKEARDKELAEQKKEREEAKAVEKAVKAVERAKAEEEKAARLKELACKKAKAEEEKAAKAKEREDKKRKKDEEQKRLQDEKDKKARSQRTLNIFFKAPSTPKKLDNTLSQDSSKDNTSPAKATAKESKTEYEKLFKPFFIKAQTQIAVLGPQMDEETRDVKSRILDESITGKRSGEAKFKDFDAEAFFSSPRKPSRRGKLHHPVKHIMEQAYKQTEKSDNTDPDYASKVMKEAREKLAKVPMKVIAFSQDVRPPYYGTMTFKPFVLGQQNLSQLARKPTGRRLPLDYEYDSEAEWQEEEGEDLDMVDDEEEPEDEDDMEEFLDDSEDAGLSRGIFANAMEPDCTGICFEDAKRLNLNQTTYDHRMEFIHDAFEQGCSIDPFSTEYWEPEQKSKTAKTSKSGETATKMPPPSAPANAFVALAGGATTDGLKLVKSELMDDVKKAILDNAALSKIGILDVIYYQFAPNKVSRTEVKNTLERVAERKGQGRQKAWALKPGHEIS
ncbi:hypothetical protein AK830_g2499 [Neonectria ditissima]|uniref:Chromatin assembly factor 1 subunit rlf2 n=1 Tax=Neonectria ditissima TaxID=78410 RepID=A0A0P7BAZ7_9HYPO|nr:hypothetical protein AK830_g2499 [Neonectria ditissima]